MGNWSRKHWMILAGCLTAIAAQLGGAHGWSDVASPMSVGGIIGEIAIVITALNTDSPKGE